MGSIDLPSADTIPHQPIHWLWPGWIAKGKLHILAGQPSTGKTTLALGFASTLTLGGTWPDGTRAHFGRVIVWSGEDGISDTIKPRLIAAGADERQVFILRGTWQSGRSRQFDFERDLHLLEAAIAQHGPVSLIIIDSIVQAVSGNSNSNTAVRKTLTPLVEFADRMGCAILGLTHVSKGSKKKSPLDRVTGSLAYGAAARVVMLAMRDENDDDRRVFVRAKSNIGPDDGGFAYRIVSAEIPTNVGMVQSSAVEWDEALRGSAKEILAQAEGDDVLPRANKLDESKQFLETLLAAGEVTSSKVQEEAGRAGFAWATVRRAAKALGVEPTKGQGLSGQWTWSLPRPSNPVSYSRFDDPNFGLGNWQAPFPMGSIPPGMQVHQQPLGNPSLAKDGVNDGLTVADLIPRRWLTGMGTGEQDEQDEQDEQVEQVEQVEQHNEDIELLRYLEDMAYGVREAHARQLYEGMPRNMGESEVDFRWRVIDEALEAARLEPGVLNAYRWLLFEYGAFGDPPRSRPRW